MTFEAFVEAFDRVVQARLALAEARAALTEARIAMTRLAAAADDAPELTVGQLHLIEQIAELMARNHAEAFKQLGGE